MALKLPPLPPHPGKYLAPHSARHYRPVPMPRRWDGTNQARPMTLLEAWRVFDNEIGLLGRAIGEALPGWIRRHIDKS